MKSKHGTMIRAGIALGVFAFAGWMGYALTPDQTFAGGESSAGAMDSKSPAVQSGNAGSSSSSSVGTTSIPGESPEARARRVAAVKQQLKDLWRSSPSYTMNWDLDRETHRLLATLEPEELGDFFKEIPPSGTLPAHAFLRLEVLKAWAVKDGPAAIEGCVVGSRIDFFSRAQAIGAWGEADPEAALAWLRREDLPESVAKDRTMMRVNLMMDLARSDFDRAVKELSGIGDSEERSSLLTSLIREAAGQGRDASELLAMARESVPEGKLSRAEEELITSTAYKDPEAALAKLAATENIDDAERGRLDLLVLDAQSSKMPGKAFDDWLARNPGLDAVPEAAWSTFSLSIRRDADGIGKWLKEMPAGSFRDEFYERGIRGFATIRRFDEAVTLSSGISDPAIRADALRALDTVWKNVDAAAAEKWRQSLPASERQAFGD